VDRHLQRNSGPTLRAVASAGSTRSCTIDDGHLPALFRISLDLRDPPPYGVGRRVRLRLRRSWNALPSLQCPRPHAAEDAARHCPRLRRHMRAYFAEENPIKRDGIAVRQLRALREHQGPREKKLRLSDVKAMFAQMKDHTTFAGSSRRGH
jgi:hypothetical protein